MTAYKNVRHIFRCGYGGQGDRFFKATDASARSYTWPSDSVEDWDRIQATWGFDDTIRYEPLDAIILESAYDRTVVPTYTINHVHYVTPPAPTGWRYVHPIAQENATYIKYQFTDPTKTSDIRLEGKWDLDCGVLFFLVRSLASNLKVVEGIMSHVQPEEATQPKIEICLPEIVTYKTVKDPNTGKDVTVPDTAKRYVYTIPVHRSVEEEDKRNIVLSRESLIYIANSEVPPQGYFYETWIAVPDETEILAEYGGNLQFAVMKRMTDIELTRNVIQIRFLGGVLAFQLGSEGSILRWNDTVAKRDSILQELHNTGKTIESSPHSWPRIRVIGHQMAILPCQMHNAAASGEVCLKSLPKTPPGCALYLWNGAQWLLNFTAQTVGMEGVKRKGASLVPIIATTDPGTDSQITKLGVTLIGSNGRTPILCKFDATYGTLYTTGVLTLAPLNVREVTISRSETEDGHVRGATCNLKVDCYSESVPVFTGNEEFVITAAILRYKDYAKEDYDETYYYIFDGRLTNVNYVVNEGIVETVDIELVDDAFRLGKKFCRDDIGSVTGRTWLDAIEGSLLAFGVPAVSIFLQGTNIAVLPIDPGTGLRVNDFYLEGDPKDTAQLSGETLQPSYETDALKWLDMLVSRKPGWVWRLEVDNTYELGFIYNIIPRPDLMPTASKFTLENTPENEQDKIYKLENPLNVEDYVNIVEIVGSTKLGSSLTGTSGGESADTGDTDATSSAWEDADSYGTPNYRYYVGDKWYKIVVDPDTTQPEGVAKVHGLLARQNRDTIIWETDGKQLFPGDIVTSNITGMDFLPTGTTMRIVGEERTLEATGENVTHRVTYTCKVMSYGS